LIFFPEIIFLEAVVDEVPGRLHPDGVPQGKKIRVYGLCRKA
jgi:hypothetical protein